VLTLLLEDCNGFTRTVAWRDAPPYFRAPSNRQRLGDFTIQNGEAVPIMPPDNVLVFRRIEESDRNVWLYREQFT